MRARLETQNEQNVVLRCDEMRVPRFWGCVTGTQMLAGGKGVYTSGEALGWMMDVAAGMQYLHSAAEGKPMIIHRDLKLENIMLANKADGTGKALAGWLAVCTIPGTHCVH